MPPGRRTVAKNHKWSAHDDHVHRQTAGECEVNPLAHMVSAPSHVRLPEIPVDGPLVFELVLFVYSVMAMLLQYVNLYRTVWWLPNSFSTYSLNFYLIDFNLIWLITAILSKRFISCIIDKYFSAKNPTLIQLIVHLTCRLTLYAVLLAIVAYTAIQVITTYPVIYSLYLSYPFFIHCILFGIDVYQPNESNKLSILKLFLKSFERRNAYIQPPIHHDCNISPESIRQEVEVMKGDFNSHIKHILFSSLMCAYYATFIPCCFAPTILHYDVWWTCQHVLLLWANTFILFATHYLPPQYCDALHKAALHLGKWQRAESRHAHVPYNVWSELQVWPRSCVVKHVKGLFRSEGICNAAEPGNISHARFYTLFHKPMRVIMFLTGAQIILIAYQMFMLLRKTEWHCVISLALLLFFNYYVLLTLLRDSFVLHWTYKEGRTHHNSS